MRITRLKRNECTRQQLHFFFQAEDGIRDGRVTGVQTCALPISSVQCVPRDSSNTLTTSAGAKKKKMKLACHTMVETPAQAPSQANKRQSRGAVKIGRATCRERGTASRSSNAHYTTETERMYTSAASFFFPGRRRHTRWTGDWSSDVCSSDLVRPMRAAGQQQHAHDQRRREEEKDEACLPYHGRDSGPSAEPSKQAPEQGRGQDRKSDV